MEFQDLLSFRKMITPTIIQILFWVGAGLSVLGGLIAIIIGFATSGGAPLILVGLLYMFIGPILIRVYCELIILLFKIFEEVVAMRKAIAGPGNEPPGFPVSPVSPAPPFSAQ